MSDRKVVNDPVLFRKLDNPFDSEESANRAIESFYEGVRELRQKFKLPNVAIVIECGVMRESMREGRAFSWAQMGDTQKSEDLLAYGFGQAVAERKEMVAKLLAGITGEVPREQ
jgi:hypothetical protein